MAQSEGVGGVDSFVLIGQETAYNVEQTTVATHLGLIQSFKPKIANNNNYSRGFVGTTTGGRNVAKVIPGTVDYNNDLDMQVINWDFLEYLLGSVAGSGTLTYSEADSPPSMTLHRCIDNPGAASTDEDAIWTGTVIDSATIRLAVGEPVAVTLALKSANKEIDTTILSQVALPSVDVFEFSGGSIELPNATPLPNIIDSMEITISNNFDMRKGLGDRRTQNAKARGRDYKIKFSVKYLSSDLTNAVVGAADPNATTVPTEYATIELNFVKGSDSAAFLFSNFTFDDHSGNEDVAEIIGEDLSGTAVSLVVTEVQA